MTSRDIILLKATMMAESDGIRGIITTSLSAMCEIPHSSFYYHFGSIDGLREEVVRKAIDDENLKVIGKALSEGHPLVQSLDRELKTRALDSLI